MADDSVPLVEAAPEVSLTSPERASMVTPGPGIKVLAPWVRNLSFRRILAPKQLLLALSVCAAYTLSAKLSLQLATVHPSATPVWPPTGIAIATLIALGLRFWPAIFLGAFLVNLSTAGSVLTSLGISTGNTLEAVLAAY